MLAELAHRSAHNSWLRLHYVLAVLTIASAAGSSALIAAGVTERPALISMALTTSLTASLLAFLGAQEKAWQHNQALIDYASLRTNVRQARLIPENGSINGPAVVRHFAERRERLRRILPSYSSFSFWRAKHMYAKGAMDYEVDRADIGLGND